VVTWTREFAVHVGEIEEMVEKWSKIRTSLAGKSILP
jgi:hypothetical protein